MLSLMMKRNISLVSATLRKKPTWPPGPWASSKNRKRRSQIRSLAVVCFFWVGFWMESGVSRCYRFRTSLGGCKHPQKNAHTKKIKTYKVGPQAVLNRVMSPLEVGWNFTPGTPIDFRPFIRVICRLVIHSVWEGPNTTSTWIFSM